LSIFRATSNLSSSTPDTIFCQSLMHRSFRVVKRSNTSPTVCLKKITVNTCYGPSMREGWLDIEVLLDINLWDKMQLTSISTQKKNKASFQLYTFTSTKQACRYRFLTVQYVYMYICRTLPSSCQMAYISKASA